MLYTIQDVLWDVADWYVIKFDFDGRGVARFALWLLKGAAYMLLVWLVLFAMAAFAAI